MDQAQKQFLNQVFEITEAVLGVVVTYKNGLTVNKNGEFKIDRREIFSIMFFAWGLAWQRISAHGTLPYEPIEIFMYRNKKSNIKSWEELKSKILQAKGINNIADVLSKCKPELKIKLSILDARQISFIKDGIDDYLHNKNEHGRRVQGNIIQKIYVLSIVLIYFRICRNKKPLKNEFEILQKLYISFKAREIEDLKSFYLGVKGRGINKQKYKIIKYCDKCPKFSVDSSVEDFMRYIFASGKEKISDIDLDLRIIAATLGDYFQSFLNAVNKIPISGCCWYDNSYNQYAVVFLWCSWAGGVVPTDRPVFETKYGDFGYWVISLYF